MASGTPDRNANELCHCGDGKSLDPRPNQNTPRSAAHGRAGGQSQHQLPARCRRQPDRASALANITGFMAFAPAGSAGFFRSILPERIGLLETDAPNFGQCLFHAAMTLLDAGHDAVCLLNSDSPTLPTAYLMAAATALAAPGDRIVLGPSTDGGYYLLGLKRPHRRLFEDVDWSTERVSAQTLARAAELDLAVHQLPSWYDVDDLHALRLLVGELFEDRRFRVWGTRPTPAMWTRRELGRLLGSTDLAAKLAISMPSNLVA